MFRGLGKFCGKERRTLKEAESATEGSLSAGLRFLYALRDVVECINNPHAIDQTSD